MSTKEFMRSFDKQIKRFREDYYRLTRISADGFICPITLQDVAVDRLCAGHILNDALGAASSHKVVQFADVDHYYGGTIEPDLINFLNFPVMSAEERLKKFKRFFIRLDDETYEVFSAGPEAAKKFPRVEIINSRGEVIDERYLRSAKIAPGHHPDVEAEFFLTVHDFALTGALLKSAYLAIFRMVGYHYGLDAVGSTVRRALAEFYFQRANRTEAKNYFRDYRAAVIVSLGGALDQLPDTLESGWMLAHYAEGTAKTGILFASSCLFRVNSVTLVVTVPAYWQSGYSLDAMSYYRKLLADRTMKHSIHLMQFQGDSFEIAQTPLEVQHVSALSQGPDGR
ncbi:MAG: hypothetical protein ACREA9_22465 [Pyrinomonadaceae bacterium]